MSNIIMEPEAAKEYKVLVSYEGFGVVKVWANSREEALESVQKNINEIQVPRTILDLSFEED